MDSVAATIARLRDAVFPEIGRLGVNCRSHHCHIQGLVDATPWLGYGAGENLHLTPAGWYAVIVSAPLFQFLLVLGTMELVAVEFLCLQIVQAKFVFDRDTSGFAWRAWLLGRNDIRFRSRNVRRERGDWGDLAKRYLNHGAHLVNFRMPVIVLAVTILILASVLCCFSFRGWRDFAAQGILEYGTLAQTQSIAFHEKWILHRASRESDFCELRTLPHSAISLTASNGLRS